MSLTNVIDQYRSYVDMKDPFTWNDLVDKYESLELTNENDFMQDVKRVLIYINQSDNSYFYVKEADDSEEGVKLRRTPANSMLKWLKLFKLRYVDQSTTTYHWIIFKNLSSIKYGTCTFKPWNHDNKEEILLELENKKIFNLFQGFNANKIVVDESNIGLKKILNHIKTCWANGNQEHYTYIIHWMADLIQNPHIKTGVALLLISKQGTGKTIILNWLCEHVLGHKYAISIDKIDHATKNFNSLIENKSLIVLNEVNSNSSTFKSDMDVLKSLITDKRQNIERKHADPYACNNYVRLIACSNHSAPIKIEESDRRYAVFNASDIYCNDIAYFNDLVLHLTPHTANVFYSYLLSIDLTNVNIKNIPKTEVKEHIVNQYSSSIHHFIEELKWTKLAKTSTELYTDYLTWAKRFYPSQKYKNLRMFSQELTTYAQLVTRKQIHEGKTIFIPVKTSQLDSEMFDNIPSQPLLISQLNDVKKINYYAIVNNTITDILDYSKYDLKPHLPESAP